MKVGFVGWRGMVGSVLMDRMLEENDFAGLDDVLFYTTSNVGGAAPEVGIAVPPLADAHDIDALASREVIISCQGGDYTSAVYEKLRATGWQGYWVDAASTLRMAEDAVIVLDPVNKDVIKEALDKGVKNFIGGNCTVSLMLMAIGGLLREGMVEWLSAQTYQAASGAGAQAMRELIAQMGVINNGSQALLADDGSILELDKTVAELMRSPSFPVEATVAPLAGSVLPFIDKEMPSGQSKEEWKAQAEGNKILGRSGNPIFMDGNCVRVGAMRCHSQALTIKLTKDIPLGDIEACIAESNDWVDVIANNKADSLHKLTPTAVTGSLRVAIGRLRKLSMGGDYLSAFTVGDQLLWGAAEPLRRMLMILRGQL